MLLGDHQAAIGYLGDLPARRLKSGHRDPEFGPWADTIETLISLDEVDRARVLLAQYDELCEKASRWSRVGAARCEGLLAAAEGNARAAFDAFDRALAEDPAHTHRLERGRTLLAIGALRRREREQRAARDALHEALATFEQLGGRLWAQKARAELARISGRRPSHEPLTQSERRVAVLAARGRRNKEIAAELFISVGTVEAHLHRVYRKLGVRSRTELARHLLSQAAEGAASQHVQGPEASTAPNAP